MTNRGVQRKRFWEMLAMKEYYANRGVVDHQAPAGSGDRDVKTLHRVDAALAKREILTAGFEFDGEAAVLRHPEDTRDYNVFRDVKTRRDRTDRFVFRFRKPDIIGASKGMAD